MKGAFETTMANNATMSEREKKKEKIKYFFKERRERSLIKYIYIYIYRILLMCAIKKYINSSIFRNILLGIEKVVITFSILEKFFFQKWKLMCALRAHMSKILIIIILKLYSFYITK